MNQLCYSIDNETYYEDLQSTLEALCDACDNGDTFTLYTGTKEPVNLTSSLCEGPIVDSLCDIAWECVGEASEDWSQKLNEDTASLDKLRSSLQKLVGDWVEEHHKVSFYNVVDIEESTWRVIDVENLEVVEVCDKIQEESK